MKIKRIKKSQKELAYYVISKDRILHTIKRYVCIDNVVYYKIVRKDAFSNIEKCTTDHTKPQHYILGKHFFTLEQAFENIDRFNIPEFNNGYKCRGCDNIITLAELCCDCAKTDMSMIKKLDSDNHEYPTRTQL